jgi:hypothetical protein
MKPGAGVGTLLWDMTNLLFSGNHAAAAHPKWRNKCAEANRSLHIINKESL